MIAMMVVNTEQRRRVLGLLHGALNGISGMLDRPQVHWKIGQGNRLLDGDEITGLCDARIRLLKAVYALDANVSKDNVSIEEVCSDAEMVRHFHERNLYKVTDLHEIDIGIFQCLMSQCERAGIRNQLHMYLFAASE